MGPACASALPPHTHAHTPSHKQARTAIGRWLNCVRNGQRLVMGCADCGPPPLLLAPGGLGGGGGASANGGGDSLDLSAAAAAAAAAKGVPFAPAAPAPPVVAEYARWNAALTAAAAAYLTRDARHLERHCGDLLTPSELAWLKGCDNPPVKVLLVLSALVKRCALNRGGWGA